MAPVEFQPLEGPERDCALRIMERAGLDPADYVLEQRCDPPQVPGKEVEPWKLVRVRSLATGMERQYGTGRAGGWPFLFERDVRRGLYGTSFPAAPGVRMGVTR